MRYVPEHKQFFVMGITSYGYGCGRKNFPGVYCSPFFYKTWLIHHLNRARNKGIFNTNSLLGQVLVALGSVVLLATPWKYSEKAVFSIMSCPMFYMMKIVYSLGKLLPTFEFLCGNFWGNKDCDIVDMWLIVNLARNHMHPWCILIILPYNHNFSIGILP